MESSSVSQTPILAALTDVATISPFFAIDTATDAAGDPEWRKFPALVGDALPGQIETTGLLLETDEPRVAASVLFQGIAGRFWAPVVATAVQHGVAPDLDPARTYWRPASPGPLALAAPGVQGRPADAATVYRIVVERHLAPLIEAIRTTTNVAEGLLWGNAASALMGSLTMISRKRSAHTDACRALIEELLTMPGLEGTGDFGPGGFRRNSCCLIYRVPTGRMCGDCALA
jgi:hypothetical protein